MIRQIRGTIVSQTHDSVVLDVGGVGYLIYTSAPSTTFSHGDEITLHTYLAVRETALDLYGFLTPDELDIFELLIALPKIGPKSAAGILAQADITLLTQAVRQNDPTYLSKMSGIGKKSAEKIVIGLKEKFENLPDVHTANEPWSEAQNGHAADTIDALIALGYSPQDARKVIAELPEDITNANDAVRAALKLLSKSN